MAETNEDFEMEGLAVERKCVLVKWVSAIKVRGARIVTKYRR